VRTDRRLRAAFDLAALGLTRKRDAESLYSRFL
jgi:hypothetical protein